MFHVLGFHIAAHCNISAGIPSISPAPSQCGAPRQRQTLLWQWSTIFLTLTLLRPLRPPWPPWPTTLTSSRPTLSNQYQHHLPQTPFPRKHTLPLPTSLSAVVMCLLEVYTLPTSPNTCTVCYANKVKEWTAACKLLLTSYDVRVVNSEYFTGITTLN